MRSTLLILSVLTISCAPAHANWVDDYFTNAVTTNPAAFKSQQMGYYTAGGFTSRVPYKAEPIMNISLPTISAGCGGIDMFWGGVSFMNAEYMVKKAEGILKNAPYVLFSLGIKALSSQFGDTMEAVQAIVDQLNSMQIDECAAAKGIIQMVKEDAGLLNEFDRLKDNADKLKSGIVKNFTSVTQQTAANPETARRDAIVRHTIDAKLVNLLTGKGYLLEKLYDNDVITKNEELAIRALVGDVMLDNTKKEQTALYQKGCANTAQLDDYIYLRTPFQTTSSLATANKECSRDNQSIHQRAEKVLNNLFTTYIDNSATLSPTDHLFISQADVPILAIMDAAAMENMEYLETTKIMLSTIVAHSFTYGLLNNLSISVSTVIDEYSRLISQENVYTQILLYALRNYYSAIRERMKSFESAYALKLDVFYSAFGLSVAQRQLEDDLQRIRFEAMKNKTN